MNRQLDDFGRFGDRSHRTDSVGRVTEKPERPQANELRSTFDQTRVLRDESDEEIERQKKNR